MPAPDEASLAEAVPTDADVLAELAEALADVLYRIQFSPEFRFEYVSPSVEKLVGYTAEEHYANPLISEELADPNELAEFGQWVQEHLFFLDYAPVIFTSAKSGFHLDRLLEAVRYVAAQLRQKIPTSILNRALQDAVERRQPISTQGHRLKFYYATQVRQAPPTFLLFVNNEKLFAPQYKKYLADEIRRAFGYEGCPIILVPKARPKTVEPVRKTRPGRSAGKHPARHGTDHGRRGKGRSDHNRQRRSR